MPWPPRCAGPRRVRPAARAPTRARCSRSSRRVRSRRSGCGGRTPRRSRARRLADQRRADHRAARRLRGRRAGRADGAHPAAGARRRRGPAGPLARDGRPLHRQPRRRARPADHLGLRRHRPHRRGQPDRDAAAELPGRARWRRSPGCCSSASASSRPGPRAGGCATRPGTTCTSTPTSRSRWRFSHQFATGADFMNNLPARVAVGRAVRGRRRRRSSGTAFVTPVRQAVRHRLRVAAVRPRAPGVVSVVVGGRHLDELRAEAGQFFRWRFLTRDLWWASNPYSLSAAPRARPAADHGQGPRRAQRARCAGCGPAPGSSPRARTAR